MAPHSRGKESLFSLGYREFKPWVRPIFLHVRASLPTGVDYLSVCACGLLAHLSPLKFIYYSVDFGQMEQVSPLVQMQQYPHMPPLAWICEYQK